MVARSSYTNLSATRPASANVPYAHTTPPLSASRPYTPTDASVRAALHAVETRRKSADTSRAMRRRKRAPDDLQCHYQEREVDVHWPQIYVSKAAAQIGIAEATDGKEAGNVLAVRTAVRSQRALGRRPRR